MKILIIDNYDSFTYNLYQYVGELLDKESEVRVIKNDELTLEEILTLQFDRIILSPGPGDPSDREYFGVCADILLNPDNAPSVLGVCLGMQGMAHYFGGRVVRAKLPMHGKVSMIEHDQNGVFRGLPQDLEIMRYHSLVAEEESLPDCLEVTARVGGLDMNGEIMGLRHKSYPIEGIQFHPESFATEGGKVMLRNFLFNN